MSDEADFEIRVEAVAVEVVRGLRHRYLRPGRSVDSVEYDTDTDPTALHFVVKDAAGEVIGVGSLHDENRVAGHPPHRVPGVRIRGLAVAGPARRRGIAAAIVERMLDVAVERGAKEVWANAREVTVKLLGKQGFKPVSSEFEIPSVGVHVVMVRPIGPKGVRKKRRGSKD